MNRTTLGRITTATCSFRLFGSSRESPRVYASLGSLCNLFGLFPTSHETHISDHLTVQSDLKHGFRAKDPTFLQPIHDFAWGWLMAERV